MPLSVGARLGPYEIVSPIGAGGMGEVYLGRDTRLDRLVAIKTVSPKIAADLHWRERFAREGRAISALNHPHICTLHDIGNQDGVDFLVMERLEGETLAERLKRGPLALVDTLRIGAQIAEALAEAHRHDLIHRDIKPANIFITTRGDAKILDFGLAKTLSSADASAETGSMIAQFETLAGPGSAMGTVAYMSPEQLRGLGVDRRTDLFSLGVVLYEMVTRARPFQGDSALAIAAAILNAPPRDFGDAHLPGPLKSLIRKLLEKDADNRYANAGDVERELKAMQVTATSAKKGPLTRAAWVAAAVAIIVIGGLSVRQWQRTTRERWVLESAIPEIGRLMDFDEYVKAAALAQEARAVLPNDPTLEKLWNRTTGNVSLTSIPSEADISIRPYHGDPNAWQSLGKTPLKNLRVPKNDYVWRVAKPGFAPTFALQSASYSTNFNLLAQAAVPPEMVVVKSTDQIVLGFPFLDAPGVALPDFLIDQHEVTNEEFQKFVDAGGYQRREFWPETFSKDGRAIGFAEAVAIFHDGTGRPGPASWEVGSFPKGLDKHPVSGVSWYEAAAFARFAGKTLPTVYHWTRAAETNLTTLIVPGSNFSGASTIPVGSVGALSGFGTTDMAGNVKEWCSNEGSGDNRLILGGGYGEPQYMFSMIDERSAWERSANFGFRTVKLATAPSPASNARLELTTRDLWKDKIVPDAVFAAYKGLYAYDKTDLNARVDETESGDGWTREKVSFDAAYGHERVSVHLFLPSNVRPPFQTVVYVPGANILQTNRFLAAEWIDDFGFLLQSGRAVLVPIIKGSFERQDGAQPGGPGANQPGSWRDHVIDWSKDLGRSLDYLETRKDIDAATFAYRGFSFGGANAPVMLAVERRFKAAVLSSAGFWFQRALPEADGINFVTRVTIPVLMLNGRYDHRFPVESAQLPIFRRLGTPDNDKKHVLYDAGHGGLPHREEVRETLDWLDKYLGPVKR